LQCNDSWVRLKRICKFFLDLPTNRCDFLTGPLLHTDAAPYPEAGGQRGVSLAARERSHERARAESVAADAVPDWRSPASQLLRATAGSHYTARGRDMARSHALRSLLLAAAVSSVRAALGLDAATLDDAHFECPEDGGSREPCSAFTFAYRAEWSLARFRQPDVDAMPSRADWVRVRADVAVLHGTSEYYLCESRLSGWALGGQHLGDEEVWRGSTENVERAQEPVFFHWERNGLISHFMHNFTQSAGILQLHRAFLSSLQVQLDLRPGPVQTRGKHQEIDVHGASWPRYHVAESGATRIYTRKVKSIISRGRRDIRKSVHFKSRQRIISIVPLEEGGTPTLPTSVDFTHNISTRSAAPQAEQLASDQVPLLNKYSIMLRKLSVCRLNLALSVGFFRAGGLSSSFTHSLSCVHPHHRFVWA